MVQMGPAQMCLDILLKTLIISLMAMHNTRGAGYFEIVAGN